MCDLFFIVDEIDFASYADDNIPFVSGDSFEDVLDSLEKVSSKLFDWLSNNQMKKNPDKCHLLTIATTFIAITIKDNEILNSESEKLLGVTIDNKLNVNNHLQKILKKANQKVHVLARTTPYMSIHKRKLLMNSFFISQFNYSPLVWMCHSRLMNNKINRLHEKCLRIVYSDKTSFFEEFLDEIYEYLRLKCLAFKNLSSTIVAEIFLASLKKYSLETFLIFCYTFLQNCLSRV